MFSTNIPVKKSFTKLFSVTQVGREPTRAYLKRFNEEMLKLKGLIEPVASEALIIGVREHFL
jgi:hypothetical protein